MEGVNINTYRYQNPITYLKVFFRRKWLFFTSLFIGLVLGIVGYFLIPPQYEAYTIILVEEQRTINPLIQDLAVATSVVQRLQLIREQILGWNNLSELVKKLNLDKNVRTVLEFEELIKNLRKHISVTMSHNHIIRLSYRHTSPQQALQVTQALTDLFIEANLQTQTKETDLAIDFLKEQLQVYKRKIKESEINELEQQLSKLSLDATEEHPMVKELKAKLDKARQELESGEFKVKDETQPISDQLRQVLKKELEKLTEEENIQTATGVSAFSQDPNTALYKLFLMDKLEAAQARDMTVNQRIYDMLLQRLETAKITQRLEASKQGTRYNVLDPPRLPLKPLRSQFIWVILGILSGCGVGVGLMFTREFLDHSFIDIDDAKRSLDLPILGAISRITTHKEIAEERRKKVVFIVMGIIASIIIISLAAVTSFITR